MQKNTYTEANLEASLIDLYDSVSKLIKTIQDNAGTMERGQEILNKLPLLDFYNDDLLRNINCLKGRF